MSRLFQRKQGGHWTADYLDEKGKRQRRTTGTANHGAAKLVLKKWEDEAALARAGVITRPVRVAGKVETPIAAAVSEFIDFLEGNGDKHVSQTEKRLERLVKECEWKTFEDIDAYELESRVKKMVDTRKKDRPKLGKSTQGHYIWVAKAFSSWLVKSRKILRDPLLMAKRPKVTAADRRVTRRYLLPEEWEWLQHTKQAVLYETAIQTGFRLQELVEIRKTHLQKDKIVLPAKYCKNKQTAHQYVTPSLLKKLPAALPFEVPFDGQEYRGAEELRECMAEARAAYESATEKPDKWLLLPRNEEGGVMDFHALRHTCGAWLALKGVYPKVIQEVMRHSSIQLTFDTYGHFFPGHAADSIQHFESFFSK